jgi:hypothetical protein
MAPIKNYTSETPAAVSMAKIEKALVEAGATDIAKKYEGSICVAISFRIVIDGMHMFFKLPARVSACFDVLWGEVKNKNRADRSRYQAQAERTAWKIVCDWTECQLSMIKLQQAETIQVFLPYVYDPVKDKTFFEDLKEKNYRALLD